MKTVLLVSIFSSILACCHDCQPVPAPSDAGQDEEDGGPDYCTSRPPESPCEPLPAGSWCLLDAAACPDAGVP